MHVLVVCTANIARSPYAEHRLRGLCDGRGALIVSSAGIPGIEGCAMDEALARELDRRGGDGRGHLSRPVTGALLTDADLVLTMEFAHHVRILEQWPWAADRVLGLRQLARAVAAHPADAAGCLPASLIDLAPRDSIAWDVADPHGRGRRAARRCADEIDGLLGQILPVLCPP